MGVDVQVLSVTTPSLGFRDIGVPGGEKFIDHPDYAHKAAELEVPIHLPPQQPPEAISDLYFMQGMPEIVGRVLSMFGVAHGDPQST